MNESISRVTVKSLYKVIAGAIAFFGTVLGIYSYFERKDTQIEFEVLSSSNVFDLNANLSKLDIVYDSTSLKKSNKNLKIFYIEVKNTGKQDILMGQYDNSDPLGMIVKDGIIIETPELVQASNNYLKKRVKSKLIPFNKLIFTNVIIEQSEYFIIKFLVLHSNKKSPEITTIGKIAGVQSIPVIDKSTSTKRETTLNEAFGGNFNIQLLRFASYFLVTFIGIISLVVFGDKVKESIKENRRKEFISMFSLENRESASTIYHIYNFAGPSFIMLLNSLIDFDDTLTSDLINKNLSNELIKFRGKADLALSQMKMNTITGIYGDQEVAVQFLKRIGVIKEVNSKIIVSKQLKIAIDQAASLIVSKKIGKEKITNLILSLLE